MSSLVDLFRVPAFGIGFMKVIERNFLHFRYHLLSVFSVMFLEPLVFFWALAFGVGHYVGPVNGMDYVEYLVPGLMLSTVMMISYAECSHICFLKINDKGRYSNFLYTPISIAEVGVGEIAWGALKGTLAGMGLGFVALFQGYLDIHHLAPAFVILFVTGLLFGSLGLLVMTIAKGMETFNFAQVVFILPMYLLSGVLFPLDALPQQYAQMSLVFPLTHALLFFRSTIFNVQDMQFYLHFALVLVSTLCLFNLAVAKFKRKFQR